MDVPERDCILPGASAGLAGALTCVFVSKVGVDEVLEVANTLDEEDDN